MENKSFFIPQLLYTLIILILLFFYLLLHWTMMIGYDSNIDHSYEAKKTIILIKSKKEIGRLYKNIILYQPSFSDAVDLGDSLTYKLTIDIDQAIHDELLLEMKEKSQNNNIKIE
ncbi:hypothetical protein [Leptospira santarosai]|uniref:hypothetical protein n=1 Tax=Leptospira santarosai TaxID=28183 RepID=UPI00077465F1|nr:hypothetical protein [Leptospira santarosai]